VDEPIASPPEPPQEPSGTSIEPPAEPAAGFRARGRVRRRARFLRKARELAYRDLGGLVFNLHRFGQRNDALVLAKLATLTQIDTELRSIEAALSARQPVTVLREAGVAACPRCAAIHAGEDRFCPACGLPLSRHVDLPISGAVSAAQPAPAVAAAQAAPQGAPTATAAAPAAGPATTAPATAPGPATPPSGPSPTAAGTDAPAPAAAAAAPPAPHPAGGVEAPPAPPAPAQRPAAKPSPASTPPASVSPGRSPTPPEKAKPAPADSDETDEQPTQIFSSRARST